MFVFIFCWEAKTTGRNGIVEIWYNVEAINYLEINGGLYSLMVVFPLLVLFSILPLILTFVRLEQTVHHFLFENFWAITPRVRSSNKKDQVVALASMVRFGRLAQFWKIPQTIAIKLKSMLTWPPRSRAASIAWSSFLISRKIVGTNNLIGLWLWPLWERILNGKLFRTQLLPKN